MILINNIKKDSEKIESLFSAEIIFNVYGYYISSRKIIGRNFDIRSIRSNFISCVEFAIGKPSLTLFPSFLIDSFE